MIANLTLDFEYPPNPGQAHTIGRHLAERVERKDLAHAGLPIEDSGAGCHLVLPLPPIHVREGTARRWNAAIRQVVLQDICPAFHSLVERAGIEMDLCGFDISRLLSAPGTWRPYNPKKQDTRMLHRGYLRHWLPPYDDGRYPVRRESIALAERIVDAYAFQVQREERDQARNHAHWRSFPVVPFSSSFSDGGAETWLRDYAVKKWNEDRSAMFQALVSGVYLKFGEERVWHLRQEIHALTGEKYSGRLDQEIERSLTVAKRW